MKAADLLGSHRICESRNRSDRPNIRAGHHGLPGCVSMIRSRPVSLSGETSAFEGRALIDVAVNSRSYPGQGDKIIDLARTNLFR